MKFYTIKSSNYSITLVLLLALSYVSVQAQPIFFESLSSSVPALLTSATLTTDHAHVITTGYSPYSSSHAGLVGKWDTAGNKIWLQSFAPQGPHQFMILTCFLQLNNGDYLIGGYMDDARDNVVLMKLHTDGAVTMFKRYKPTSGLHYPSIRISKLVQTPDGSIIAIGTGGSGQTGQPILWMKTDENGNSPVFKSINIAKDLFNVQVFPQPDNGVLLVNYSGNLNGDTGDDVYPQFMRLDVSGNIVYTKNIYFSFPATLTDCIQTADGNFILIGNGLTNSYVLKVNTTYQTVWMKTYPLGSSGYYGSLQSILETTSQEYFITGARIIPSPFSYQNLLMKIDNSGNVIFAEQIDALADYNEALLKALPSSSGRWLGWGNAEGTGGGQGKSEYINFNGSGLTACSATSFSLTGTAAAPLYLKNKTYSSQPLSFTITAGSSPLTVETFGTINDICPPLRNITGEAIQTTELSAYPNPATDQVTFELPGGFTGEVNTLQIRNLLGQELFKIEFTGNSITVPVKSLQRSQCICIVKAASGKTLTCKLMLQ